MHNEPESFGEIDAEKVSQTIDKIDQALSGKEVDKKVKQKLNYAKRKWHAALEKYEKYEHQMGERNSLSKTDPDATFMRMKEDHMLNGQLKPAYNGRSPPKINTSWGILFIRPPLTKLHFQSI